MDNSGQPVPEYKKQKQQQWQQSSNNRSMVASTSQCLYKDQGSKKLKWILKETWQLLNKQLRRNDIIYFMQGTHMIQCSFSLIHCVE